MNKCSIELLNLSKGYEYYQYQSKFKGYEYYQLNFSSEIRLEDYLVNYYSSAVENCYSTIAISNKQPINDDDVVGINCFDELLFRNDFISYARDNF